MTASRKCIVIAWTDEESIVDPTAPMARRDLGERPKMKTVQVAKAAVWLNEGSSADAKKAKAYLARDQPHGRVFIFPVDEPDPLGRARSEILKPQRRRR